jgi:hypothetical protein
MRCADHATPSIRQSLHKLRRQAAAARSVLFTSGLKARSLVHCSIGISAVSEHWYFCEVMCVDGTDLRNISGYLLISKYDINVYMLQCDH